MNLSKVTDPKKVQSWHWCTAEGSRDFDRLNDRLMSFREKVEWLEEAESLSLVMQASGRKLRIPASEGE